MKRLLPIFAVCVASYAVAANEVYTTKGDSTLYTFAKLAKIEDSGVTVADDGVTFTLTKDIKVLATDTIKLDNNATLKFGDAVLVSVYGKADLAPADTASVVANGDVNPKGFHFLDSECPNEVKHVRFEGAGLKIGGPAATTVENCSFILHNAKVGNYAIGFVGNSLGNVVRNCYFYKSNLSAIGSGSNVAVGVTIEYNTFDDCSTVGRNYPVINSVVSGDNGSLIIRGNRLIGTGRTTPGAISVSNMLVMTGKNEVLVEDNNITDFRYGINVYGYQNTRVINNRIVDCHYETNANNGGSGITVYGSVKYPATAYIQGNYIDGSLWGVTAVSGAIVNMGRVDVPETDENYNPGGNTLKNNGNCGTTPEGATTAYDPSIPYDLYNNTTNTIYAQNNIWGGADQSAAEIEKRIFHKNDNSSLGEVIYLTGTSGVSLIEAGDSFDVRVNGDGSFSVDGVSEDTPVTVYSLTGAILWKGAAASSINIGHRGVVVVAVGTFARRVAL
jgi:hypothetical protein